MNIARTICPLSRQNVGLSFSRKFRFSSTNYETTQPEVQEEKFDFEDLKVIERTERRKASIPPFMKNVFVSTFNRDLLAYPEILNKEESEALTDRASRIKQSLSNTEKNEEDRKIVLKQANMYAAPVSITNGGLAMNVTERLQYLEAISTDLKLAKQISEHWVGLEALSRGLDRDVYQKVLPDLISGENCVSLCVKETISTRIAQPDFRTTAQLDGQGIWRVNGEKECYDCSGYYLVLCALEASRLKAFLVHPNAEGVSFKTSLINFRNTPAIPLDHITDTELVSIMGLSRLDTACLTTSAVKEAIRASVEYVRGRFVTGKPLADAATIRKRVGEALMTVYASESAAYFTAGLLDGYESPDADIEMAACRNYITQHGIESVLRLSRIPGLQQCEEFHARADQLQRLTRDENDDNVTMFIALNGLHHAGKMMSQEIKQTRNPLFNPGFIFKKVIADRHQTNDNPKLTLYLAEHLHPTLKPASEQLEYCILRMRYACETLMSRHGADVQVSFVELERLSHAASEILAMTSVLARASRAYCIGLRNAEIEMKLAASFVENTKASVRQLILEIDQGEFLNLDHYKLEFGRKVLDTSSLLVERPIERVFW